MVRFGMILTVCMLAGVVPGTAQQAGLEEQLEEALLAAPESLRDEATVLGYGGSPRAEDVLTVVREGTNDLLCIADDPAREGFHVACYHASLDPYMRLGRTLRADGLGRSEVMEARYAALEAGEFSMPAAAAVYSLSADSPPDPATGSEAEGLRRLTAVYVPDATVEGTGLPGRPSGGGPWLMLPGTPWAHIMISN